MVDWNSKVRLVYVLCCLFQLIGVGQGQTKYDLMIMEGICRAECNGMYGSRLDVSPYPTHKALYRPWRCENSLCDKCSAPCSKTSKNGTECRDSCMGSICNRSCLSLAANIRTFKEKGELPVSKTNIKVTDPLLLCTETTKEKGTVFLNWQVSELPSVTNASLIFILSLRRGNDEGWRVLGQTASAILPIAYLDPGGMYRFRITPVTSTGIVGKPKESRNIYLLSDGEVGDPPESMHVDEITPSHKGVNVVISWSPGKRPACRLRLYCLPLTCPGESVQNFLEHVPTNTWRLMGLHHNCTYRVLLQVDGSRTSSGDTVTMNLTTPTCLNITNNSFALCAPSEPRNVTYTVTEQNEYTADVVLKWLHPTHSSSTNIIEYYNIVWHKIPSLARDTYDSPHQGVVEVNGTISTATLSGLNPNRKYSISIVAVSSGGEGRKVTMVLHFPEKQGDGVTLNTYHYLLAIPIAVFILAGLVIFCVRRQRRFHHTALNRVSRGTAFTTINPFYKAEPSKDQLEKTRPLLDDYEVNWAWFNVGECLGEGAFGKVLRVELRKGYTLNKANPNIKTFAVKVLREFPTDEERRNLLLEIEFMKELGQHRHIVSLVGCCTIGQNIRFIMDFCPFGDLRNYLRTYRMEPSCKSGYQGNISTASSVSSDSGISRNASKSITSSTSTTTNQSGDNDITNSVPLRHLLSFARQIALGMEYLSKQRFVHRDLAARNVLVCEDKSLKISDFGLTRDVYQNNIYEFSPSKKIPYKWMPVETLFDQVFTTKSDVWSYAVVLWEIVTLGGFPYPGIQDKDLFRLLKNGYRMEKPINCSQKVYNIMLECWRPSPNDRPSFTELRLKIESLMEENSHYIDLQVHQDHAKFHSLTKCERRQDSIESDQGVDMSSKNE